jgi:hypothetical protein
MTLTTEQINEHKAYIKSMSLYDIHAFFKCAHKNHMYFNTHLPFLVMLTAVSKRG